MTIGACRRPGTRRSRGQRRGRRAVEPGAGDHRARRPVGRDADDRRRARDEVQQRRSGPEEVEPALRAVRHARGARRAAARWRGSARSRNHHATPFSGPRPGIPGGGSRGGRQQDRVEDRGRPPGPGSSAAACASAWMPCRTTRSWPGAGVAAGGGSGPRHRPGGSRAAWRPVPSARVWPPRPPRPRCVRVRVRTGRSRRARPGRANAGAVDRPGDRGDLMAARDQCAGPGDEGCARPRRCRPWPARRASVRSSRCCAATFEARSAAP